jgi:hypothetical protein
MNEAEWLECRDPWLMLAFLRDKASERKLRLTACATCRSVWPLLGKGSRRAVLLGEQMADEPVSEAHRAAVVRGAIEAVCRFEEANGGFFMAADMAYRVPCNDGWYAVEWTLGNWSGLSACVCLVTDIFGNPFRPLPQVGPAWLTWGGGTVPKLARFIYEGRAFDRLPVLADALEEAGCDAAELLDHLRGPGPHVRGCWALDLLPGKSWPLPWPRGKGVKRAAHSGEPATIRQTPANVISQVAATATAAVSHRRLRSTNERATAAISAPKTPPQSPKPTE